MRIPPREGYLFDPDRYLFLEGRRQRTELKAVAAEVGQGDHAVLLAMMAEDQQPPAHFAPQPLDALDLVVLDELGYVVMPDAAAELLFQVIAGRAEQAAIIVTTNLPFSEWPTKIPNARLCKAMLDRLTDRAHIIETGTESYRFRRTMARKGGKA